MFTSKEKNLKYEEKIIELSSLCDIKRARVLSIISIGVPFFPRSFLILLALSIYVCIWHQFVLYEISDTARTSYTLCARFQFSKNKFIILFIRHTKFGYIMFCCVFFCGCTYMVLLLVALFSSSSRYNVSSLVEVRTVLPASKGFFLCRFVFFAHRCTAKTSWIAAQHIKGRSKAERNGKKSNILSLTFNMCVLCGAKQRNRIKKCSISAQVALSLLFLSMKCLFLYTYFIRHVSCIVFFSPMDIII